MVDEIFCIKEEIPFSVPEHMVVLSFNNDSGAVKFNDWLDEVGYDAFQTWQRKKKKRYED